MAEVNNLTLPRIKWIWIDENIPMPWTNRRLPNKDVDREMDNLSRYCVPRRIDGRTRNLLP
jgi:hypothetical protein